MTELDLVALARVELALMGDPFKPRRDLLYRQAADVKKTDSDSTEVKKRPPETAER